MLRLSLLTLGRNNTGFVLGIVSEIPLDNDVDGRVEKLPVLTGLRPPSRSGLVQPEHPRSLTALNK